MVTRTSPDCLPYFDSTDPICVNTGSTCEPSTVWCDFAAAVDVKLDELDAVVDRTATTVPMAWVELTAPIARVVGDPELAVPFDSVRADTDDMVDLSANSSGFTFNTPGLYVVFAYFRGVAVAAPGNSLDASAIIRYLPRSTAYGAFTPGDMEFSAQVVNAQRAAASANVTNAFTAGMSLSMSMFGGGVVGDAMVYSKIGLGAAWVGDLP